MIELYHHWRSSASRRVRLALAEKGLGFAGHVVDLAAGEQHSPDYLKINPDGVVPTLIHDGRPLHESSTICEYLDDVFPEPPLRPRAPYERALMRNWVRYMDEKCLPALIVFNWAHHLQPLAMQWTDEELDQRLRRIPSKARQEAWRRTARKPYTETERDEARGQLVALMTRMETALQGATWLTGESYSIADIAAVPFLKRIEEEIAPDEITETRRPRVAGLWQRLQARPAFAVARIEAFASTGERTP
jgi:glutathione S-transferase